MIQLRIVPADAEENPSFSVFTAFRLGSVFIFQ